ncbi:MAG: hypothetical protein HYY42_05400, partial [Chloroflexi bacterium]|nr:hypothetical protein [Chloroflexota bacterium]
MTSALAATAAMSVGAVAATLALRPLVAFSAFAIGLALVVLPTLARRDPSRRARVLDLVASRLGL